MHQKPTVLLADAPTSWARQKLLDAAMIPALRNTSSVLIQRVARGIIATRHLRHARLATCTLQKVSRGRATRRSLCALALQTAVRSYLARRSLCESRNAAVRVQQSARRMLHQASFRGFRTAANRSATTAPTRECARPLRPSRGSASTTAFGAFAFRTRRFFSHPPRPICDPTIPALKYPAPHTQVPSGQGDKDLPRKSLLQGEDARNDAP